MYISLLADRIFSGYDKWKEKEEEPQYFTRSNKNGLYLEAWVKSRDRLRVPCIVVGPCG